MTLDLSDRPPEEVAYGSDLVNTTGIPFGELLKLPDSVLGRSVRRLLSDLHSGEEVVAGHGDSL
jgi:FXSXX-COOH protein